MTDTKRFMIYHWNCPDGCLVDEIVSDTWGGMDDDWYTTTNNMDVYQSTCLYEMTGYVTIIRIR